MANVVMAAKPKKVSSFIINGQVYEGTANDYYSGKLTSTRTPVVDELGGVESADKVAEETEGNK